MNEQRQQESTYTSTAQHSMLNEQAIFASLVTRLFRGSVHELLCELLQNSQRAGATHIAIDFPDPEQCVLSDNGHGLLPSRDLEGLRALLVLAESLYLDETVAVNQHPMGMGLYALIANERVRELRIQSNGLVLTLDTRRWLADQVYRESWQERVQMEQAAEHGFQLTVVGTSTLMQEVRTCLLDDKHRRRDMHRYDWVRSAMSPVCGYIDLLEVTLDGDPLPVGLPDFLALRGAEIEDDYQGNSVRISLFPTGNAGVVVNWYGQIVVDSRAGLGFQAYLSVRAGRPVHPMAPTRNGLIQDAALEDFYRWAEDRIFDWLQSRSGVSAKVVKQAYAINGERAQRECPFVIVQHWLPLAKDYTFNSCRDYTWHRDDGSGDDLGPEEVLHKADLSDLILLDQDVALAVYTEQEDRSQARPALYNLGLTSLLRATGLTAYRPGLGAKPTHILWWDSGDDLVDDLHTTDLGVWGLGVARATEDGRGFVNIPPVNWTPLTEGWVFVADGAVEYDIAEVDWLVGIEKTEEMVNFLLAYGWGLFNGSEEAREDFDDSLDNLINLYRPKKSPLVDAIDRSTPAHALPSLVQPFLPQGYDAYAATWTVIPRHGNDTWMVERNPGLDRLQLRFSDGTQKVIRLVDPEERS